MKRQKIDPQVEEEVFFNAKDEELSRPQEKESKDSRTKMYQDIGQMVIIIEDKELSRLRIKSYQDRIKSCQDRGFTKTSRQFLRPKLNII